MSKLNAGFDRVIVKELKARETTKGGLVIPDTGKSKPNSGEIIAVGESTINAPITPKFNVGDIVIYGEYAGVKFIHENEEYKSVKHTDIEAVIINE